MFESTKLGQRAFVYQLTKLHCLCMKQAVGVLVDIGTGLWIDEELIQVHQRKVVDGIRGFDAATIEHGLIVLFELFNHAHNVVATGFESDLLSNTGVEAFGQHALGISESQSHFLRPCQRFAFKVWWSWRIATAKKFANEFFHVGS